MLACHSSDQFKSSAVHWDLAELPAARKGLQFILRSYFIISGQNKQELQSKTSIWLVMKTLLMCWCWVWQYESQP